MKDNLRKAYDTMGWEAIDFALKKIGVLEKFGNWVQVCMQKARFSIIVNSFPYGDFLGKKGNMTGGSNFALLVCACHGNICRLIEEKGS